MSQRRGVGEYVENLLETALAEGPLSTVDRALCLELVFGVVRWQATLDWLISRKTGGRPQKPALQDLLRLGLYQIFWLDRIPDHAAVHETVEMAKRAGFGPQSGFVNAVLRGYLREADVTKAALAELKASQPALGYSHPEWLVGRWQNRWGGEKTRQLLEWNNAPPKTYARVNTLRTDAAKLLTQWRDENVEYDFFQRDWCEENLVFALKSHPPLFKLPSFQQGMFYVQDPSTLLAVRELDPQPGDLVLDLCAAPGGKTTFIAQRVRNEARVMAQDVSAERVKLIQENCARLGVTCVETCTEPRDEVLAEKGKGRKGAEESPIPAAARPHAPGLLFPSATNTLLANKSFDRILIDSPCSNTGVMRRRVDLRWRIRPEEIARLRTDQLDLLRQAAARVLAGGVMVYSTCSLEPEENSEVARQFLAEHSAFRLERELELLPFVDGVDGAFVARMRRN